MLKGVKNLNYLCFLIFMFYKLLPWIDIKKLERPSLSLNPNAIYLLNCTGLTSVSIPFSYYYWR